MDEYQFFINVSNEIWINDAYQFCLNNFSAGMWRSVDFERYFTTRVKFKNKSDYNLFMVVFG